jgi:hypothetical protein
MQFNIAIAVLMFGPVKIKMKNNSLIIVFICEAETILNFNIIQNIKSEKVLFSIHVNIIFKIILSEMFQHKGFL